VAGRRKQPTPELTGPPALTMPRSKAAEILNRHADAGRALLAEAETIGDHTAWKDWSEKFDRWRHVTETALRRLYTTEGGLASPGLADHTNGLTGEDLE
jgi:hypothetical protein